MAFNHIEFIKDMFFQYADEIKNNSLYVDHTAMFLDTAFHDYHLEESELYVLDIAIELYEQHKNKLQKIASQACNASNIKKIKDDIDFLDIYIETAKLLDRDSYEFLPALPNL